MKTWKFGDSATVEGTTDLWKNQVFADLTGDMNPVHFDVQRMKKTSYKKPIANGIQTLALVGTTIVKLFTTENTMPVAIQQHNSFVKPVYIGDKLTATCTVVNLQDMPEPKPNDYWVSCLVKNQDKEPVLSATFKVRVLNA